MWDYTEKYPVLLEEKESDGTIVRYTYAGNRERAYADVTKNSENEKAQVYSLYTDRLGSTRWALDENAEVAAKTEYDAWGKPETETVSSKLKGINISKSYTGYVYDETTGYWNAGARMYNSTDREFIQKDPKAGNVYETLTQNGYIYCGDNPLYYIDPDGCSYISTLGNAGRTAFNVVKSGVAGGLGFYTRICCEIDNMPTWAKAAVGTTGIVVAGVSGVGAAAIAEAVIASAGISAATDGAFYSIYALNNGSFSKSELKDTVINGAANGYMFAGAGLGVAGIRNAAKSGKLAGFMADEAGSVSYEGGTGSTRRQVFREAKEATGIPKSAEYKTHKFVFDGTSENRIVYEFDVSGEKKYIIEHPFDKMGRGNHFHGADATKGNPFSKGRYNQYPGHFPEDFNGFK